MPKLRRLSDAAKSTRAKCNGYPVGVVLMLFHALVLGVDFTAWISLAPAYYADILNHSGTYNSTSASAALLLTDAASGFSVSQSVWAIGQMVGGALAAPLPR